MTDTSKKTDPAHGAGCWPLRDSVAFELSSKHVGSQFAIGVWSPASFLAEVAESAHLHGLNVPSTTALDVVYVLDGAWALGMAAGICQLQLADMVRRGFPPLLLVGIDYPIGTPNRRSRDLVMDGAIPADMEQSLKSLGPDKSPGGAANFLRFIEDELDPMIRRRFPTSDRPAAILGDSFGGTFSFFAFLQQSKLFDRFWLGSPGVFATEADYPGAFANVISKPLNHQTRIYLSIGEKETNGGFPLYEEMGRTYNRMISSLSTTPNAMLDYKAKIYSGETHTSVVAPAMNDAISFLFRPDERR